MQASLGTSVLVTRPRNRREPNDPLSDYLRQCGAEVLFQPAIEISDPPDWQPVDRAMERLAEFDWIVFSSVHGVTSFFERFLHLGGDLNRFANVKLAAIGSRTAEALQSYRLKADRVPEEFRAEALAETLGNEAAGRRFLLIRASRGREVLGEQLKAAGGVVEQVVAYTQRDVERAEEDIALRLASGRIEWITVTSSSIARSLVRLFGDDLHRAKLASISPITSGVLRELGFEPAVEAREYTALGVAEAIVNFLDR